MFKIFTDEDFEQLRLRRGRLQYLSMRQAKYFFCLLPLLPLKPVSAIPLPFATVEFLVTLMLLLARATPLFQGWPEKPPVPLHQPPVQSLLKPQPSDRQSESRFLNLNNISSRFRSNSAAAPSAALRTSGISRNSSTARVL